MTDKSIEPFKYDNGEMIRLILQELRYQGYHETASLLERESGTLMENPESAQLKEVIMQGDWPHTLKLLSMIPLEESKLKELKFLIGKQKYHELLHKGESEQALNVLRSELSTLGCNQQELHQLAQHLMTNVSSDGRAVDLLGERRELIGELQRRNIFSKELMSEGRLRTLLDQAMQYQYNQCEFHIQNENNVSLLKDHNCGKVEFECFKECQSHEDEIWDLEFSPDGKYLASSSKDCTVSILRTEDWPLYRVISEHNDAIKSIAWSPNSQMILTGCRDKIVRVWRVSDGICLRRFTSIHADEVLAVAWLPDSRHFLSSSLDQVTVLVDVDDAVVKHSWARLRATFLSVSPKSDFFLAAADESKLFKISLNGEDAFQVIAKWELPDSEGLLLVSGLALAHDSGELVVGRTDSTIYKCRLGEGFEVTGMYRGHCCERYSCGVRFAGAQESLIVAGSEDGCVYIWNRQTGHLLSKLHINNNNAAHNGSVNAVAYSVNHRIFASAGDDALVKLWRPKRI